MGAGALPRGFLTDPAEPEVRLQGALMATVHRRALITHRVDLARAAALLPRGIAPIARDGHAFVSICYSDIRHLRPVGAPTLVGVSFQYLVTRMLVQVSPRTGPPFVAAHVLDAVADSTLVRLGTRLIHRLPMGPARIELHDDDGSWRLTAFVGNETTLDCTLRAGPDAEVLDGSVFASRRDALDTMLSMKHGTYVGPHGDRARVLFQTFDPRAIRAGRASGQTFPRAAALGLPDVHVDHVLMAYDVPYRYALLGRSVGLPRR
jgi:hypothetical protein